MPNYGHGAGWRATEIVLSAKRAAPEVGSASEETAGFFINSIDIQLDIHKMRAIIPYSPSFLKSQMPFNLKNHSLI